MRLYKSSVNFWKQKWNPSDAGLINHKGGRAATRLPLAHGETKSGVVASLAVGGE